MIPAGDHDPRALALEPPGYGQAQAGGTTRDERALPLQQAHDPSSHRGRGPAAAPHDI
jgi:hypothetical protein